MRTSEDSRRRGKTLAVLFSARSIWTSAQKTDLQCRSAARNRPARPSRVSSSFTRLIIRNKRRKKSLSTARHVSAASAAAVSRLPLLYLYSALPLHYLCVYLCVYLYAAQCCARHHCSRLPRSAIARNRSSGWWRALLSCGRCFSGNEEGSTWMEHHRRAASCWAALTVADRAAGRGARDVRKVFRGRLRSSRERSRVVPESCGNTNAKLCVYSMSRSQARRRAHRTRLCVRERTSESRWYIVEAIHSHSNGRRPSQREQHSLGNATFDYQHTWSIHGAFIEHTRSIHGAVVERSCSIHVSHSQQTADDRNRRRQPQSDCAHTVAASGGSASDRHQERSTFVLRTLATDRGKNAQGCGASSLLQRIANAFPLYNVHSSTALQLVALRATNAPL